MKWNYKKIFAGILAAALAMNSLAVPLTLESRAASKGSGESGGSGTLLQPPNDVFNVVVPTQPDPSENTLYKSIYDFILDPHKLAATGDGKLAGKNVEAGATVYFENSPGMTGYEWSSTSDKLTVINKSTTRVDVKLTAMLSGMDGIRLTGDNTFDNDTSASVYMALKDDRGKVSPIDKYGAFLKTTMEGQPDAYNVKYDSGQFKYEFKSDAELAADNVTFPEYSFQLNGACNPSSIWSKVSSTLEPQIAVTWYISIRPKNLAPSIGKTSYVMCKGRDIAVDVDLGSGTLAADDIKSVTYAKSTGTATVGKEYYTFKDGVLTFKSSYVSNILDAGVLLREHTITFNDKAETRVKIKWTPDDMAPFIDKTSYTMHNGQAVTIDVDLGSGTLGATGIKAITYVKASGPATLASSYYTLGNGVLTFNESLVATVLASGVKEREYTVIFNDKAETSVIITLSVNGTPPSIQTTEYTMSRDQDVVIDSIDLGTEDMKASGIQSITYSKSSGTAALSSNYYSFDGVSLTIDKSYITTMLNAGVLSRDFTITFDNAAQTKVIVTLSADSVAPSIVTTSYPMSTGNAVTIDINLGSGALGATGIKSITYTKATGAATLATTNYTLKDGVLTLNASHISTVISAGVAEREYTITFNDQASTSVKVTLTANGTFPSVQTTTYTVGDGDSAEIETDLGSGEFEATGIRSITYHKSSGVATLPTNYYSFADGKLTIYKSYISMMLNAGVQSREFTITFNNPMSTKVVITLNARPVAPSVGTASYTMTRGKEVLVDINLGSGTPGATGIKSITYKKNNTATTFSTLPTSYYTIVNGKLQLKASYINGVVDAGVKSREYIITFNDQAETQATFTLTM